MTLSLVIYSSHSFHNLMPGSVLGMWDTVEHKADKKCLLKCFIVRRDNIPHKKCKTCRLISFSALKKRMQGDVIHEEDGGGDCVVREASPCLCLTIFHLFFSLFLTPPVSFLVFSP